MADGGVVDKAAAHGKLARQLDDAGQYKEAVQEYIKASEYLQLAKSQFKKTPDMANFYHQRMLEYITRAEELKKEINKPKPTQKSSGGGERPKQSGDDEDKEKSKMQEGMESSIITEKPNVKWDDVAGLDGAKSSLKEAVILPIRFPQLFVGKRKPWRGILLYGPPGTGKSYLAKAVATEAQSTFLSVSSADLVSKWLGDSEKLVRTMFEMARERKPAIIFIDEIDSLASARSDNESESSRRIKTEFLVQMQGVGETMDQVLLLAATNLPWNIDSAIRRRFEKRIYIPLPEHSARGTMIKIHLGNTPNDLNDNDFHDLGMKTEGFSGSDISVMVRDAIMEPVRKCQDATHFMTITGPDPNDTSKIRNDLLTPCSPGQPGAQAMKLVDVPPDRLAPPDVCYRDFRKVLLRAKPSVGQDDLQQYRDWTSQFGQEG